MQVESLQDIPPLVPLIKSSETGKPYLAGSKCKSCGHVFAGERQVCANCTERDEMLPVHLAETGKLYVYTVVHRTFPGVKTPFIDAIADLDDGSHLKGTLLEIIAYDKVEQMRLRKQFKHHIHRVEFRVKNKGLTKLYKRPDGDGYSRVTFEWCQYVMRKIAEETEADIVLCEKGSVRTNMSPTSMPTIRGYTRWNDIFKPGACAGNRSANSGKRCRES